MVLNPLDEETKGKIRQLYRLLMSWSDFKHARLIASYILENNIHSCNEGSRVLLEALNCAMIVAYCRPFSSNDRGNQPKIPDLPLRFLKLFNEEEREMHEVVMSDRNTVLAHSDSRARDYEPVIMEVGKERFLMPWSNDTRAPLTRECTEIFCGMCSKLEAAVATERFALEPQLLQYFPVWKPDVQ